MPFKWIGMLGLLLFYLPSFASDCKGPVHFSLELVDQTPLIVDIRYEAGQSMAKVVRLYKGALPDSIPIQIGKCDLEDGAIYHVYFKQITANQLNMNDAVRCKRLYQDLVEYVRVTGTPGTQPEQYNAFMTTIKKTHQELVILRALKEQYNGKVKHSLLLTNNLKDIDAFTIIKGKIRLGKRTGKWIYYEWEDGNWVRHTRRYPK